MLLWVVGLSVRPVALPCFLLGSAGVCSILLFWFLAASDGWHLVSLGCINIWKGVLGSSCSHCIAKRNSCSYSSSHEKGSWLFMRSYVNAQLLFACLGKAAATLKYCIVTWFIFPLLIIAWKIFRFSYFVIPFFFWIKCTTFCWKD
jgi:hypothetical protein